MNSSKDIEDFRKFMKSDLEEHSWLYKSLADPDSKIMKEAEQDLAKLKLNMKLYIMLSKKEKING